MIINSAVASQIKEGALVGSLRVGRITSMRPQKFATECTTCGSKTEHSLAELVSAPVCKSRSCGNTSDRRIERHKEFKQDLAQEREVARKRAEAPLTPNDMLVGPNAKEELKRLEKERAFRHGTLFNIDVDDELQRRPFTVECAKQYTEFEVKAYIKTHPEFYECAENVDALKNVFRPLGVIVITQEMMAQAVNQLRAGGFLKERPAPSPVDLSHTWVETEAQRELRLQREKEAADSHLWGYNPTTGNPMKLTPRQIDLLSSAELKAWKRIRSDVSFADILRPVGR